MNRARRTRGFTLIELMVVLVLVTIMIGLIGVNLGRSESSRVRDEAERLALVLQAARDEAILQGRVLAVTFAADGYRFLRVGTQGKLEPVEGDDLFRPRALPDGMALSVELDGAPARDDDGLILDPAGTLPPLVITVRLGTIAWQARVAGTAPVRIQAVESTRAG